jgi:hypothetical protein
MLNAVSAESVGYVQHFVYGFGVFFGVVAGVLAGVAVSLVAQSVIEKRKEEQRAATERRKEEQQVEYLKFEFGLNIDKIGVWVGKLNTWIEAASNETVNTYLERLDLSKIFTVVTMDMLSKGLIYKYLNSEDILKLDRTLASLFPEYEISVNNRIAQKNIELMTEIKLSNREHVMELKKEIKFTATGIINALEKHKKVFEELSNKL